MPEIPEQYFSIFFVLGLLVVAAYAWQRFNEPSFPNRETLPRTVAPLRYLFLRRAYRRALLTYVAVSLLLYSVLVLPGPSIIPALSTVRCRKRLSGRGMGSAGGPPARRVWCQIPISDGLPRIEEWLRRSVHAWFFVPEGIVRTIGVLEDARIRASGQPAGRLAQLR